MKKPGHVARLLKLMTAGAEEAELWRASKYVVDGGVIRPARGAKVQKSRVWQSWDNATDLQLQRKNREAPAYIELLDLGRKLEWGIREDAERQRMLLNWCNRYGLLGLLVHRTREIVLAPRWARDPEDTGWIVPIQRGARLEDGSWYTWELPLAVFRERPPSDFRAGAPLREKDTYDVREEGIPTGYAIVADKKSGRWRKEPLATTWAKFFAVPPGEEETYRYPFPNDPGFWLSYGEPVDELMDAIGTLSYLADPEFFLKSTHRFGNARRRRSARFPARESTGPMMWRPPGTSASEPSATRWNVADRAFNDHLGATRLRRRHNRNGKVSPAFSVHCTFQAFLIMMLADECARCAARMCDRPACRTWFRATREGRRFCSALCEDAERKYKRRHALAVKPQSGRRTAQQSTRKKG